MKKVLKTVLGIVVGICLTAPIGASATTNPSRGKETRQYSAETQEWMKKFPNLKADLEKNTTGKLAGSSDTYVRFTPKNKNNTLVKNKVYNKETVKEDFNVETFDKKGYEKERAKELSQNGTFTTNMIGQPETPPCSWLRLDIQVYYGTGLNYYMAYNYCSWLTPPACIFTDAIGIGLSEGLTVSGDASSRHSEYSYPNGTDEGGMDFPTVKIGDGARGVFADFGLHGAGEVNRETWNDIMVSTGVAYSNASALRCWINGQYVHKQIALGGFGMDANGVLSVSVGISTDSQTGFVYVTG